MASNKDKSKQKRAEQQLKVDADVAMEQHIRQKLKAEELAFIVRQWRRFLPRGGGDE